MPSYQNNHRSSGSGDHNQQHKNDNENIPSDEDLIGWGAEIPEHYRRDPRTKTPNSSRYDSEFDDDLEAEIRENECYLSHGEQEQPCNKATASLEHGQKYHFSGGRLGRNTPCGPASHYRTDRPVAHPLPQGYSGPQHYGHEQPNAWRNPRYEDTGNSHWQDVNRNRGTDGDVDANAR